MADRLSKAELHERFVAAVGPAASGTLARQERLLRTGSEVVICAPRHLVQAAIAERASGEQAAGGDLGFSRGTSRARGGQPYTPPARDSADLCMTHGVVLSWPEVFDELLDACA